MTVDDYFLEYVTAGGAPHWELRRKGSTKTLHFTRLRHALHRVVDDCAGQGAEAYGLLEAVNRAVMVAEELGDRVEREVRDAS
jgi:hypothetical protein